MQLVIGNKNYSSWSMRPWVLLHQMGIAFEEHKLRFDFKPGSPYRKAVASVNPSGQVPVLLDEGFAVWDSLAIAEYLNDKYPAAGVWPEDRLQRARARSVSAEMHSGFGPLRSHCPMNVEARLHEVGARLWQEHEALRASVARVQALWGDALKASGGPFLFGRFCAADAMFAPVCMRMLTYGLPMSDTAEAYVQRVSAAPGVAAWIKDALAEQDYLDFEEPYRKHR